MVLGLGGASQLTNAESRARATVSMLVAPEPTQQAPHETCETCEKCLPHSTGAGDLLQGVLALTPVVGHPDDLVVSRSL